MTPPEPAVIARGVCFAYSGDDVLHDVSLELRPGEVTAIVGPNGSGKSTLIELLAGVIRPRAGAVDRRGDVALVVQRPAAPEALPVSAADVVAMGTWKRGRRMRRRDARSAVFDALDRVGMADLADRPLAALSGGQRQRVFIAQGLVRRPDVLLLDEPAAGLDRRSVERARLILSAEAGRGAAVACITHDEAEAAAADRMIRLDRGVRVA
ncbi:zinc/manganese transport system ATP-binding protein [Microbacterium terrae]|uniref:High-affinity zinc uptake system ATP-binding protein ZnuC n=1 Tax=Microbacterium terrae TaxID=69369 RepID=A0A0M2HG83_9MICO|nr:zinc ABC transporter ATP-binding protein AztA [Microbacterium terrae]KJL43294.1 High-affinity zinc uptake system ATP-binding protein ZnuC [Microbacterium terrae]MBP1078501.1 zinc/manganese transport system ATP-binding protein [Microbacterium terrae]GLJ97902.1 ABC transporter ATP-binding protein [Microbacterium terrae]